MTVILCPGSSERSLATRFDGLSWRGPGTCRCHARHGRPPSKRVTRTNTTEKEKYVPTVVEMLVGVAATDLSTQVSELSGTIERLESTIAEQADQMRELKELNTSLIAIRREKEKKCKGGVSVRRK
jgi:TolA-binding protein